MHPLSLWIALLVTLLAAGHDLRTRRIPNWLTLATIGAGCVLQMILFGPLGLGLAFLGSFAAGLPALALFKLRAMGGGDVKLLAGCGAVLGPSAGFELLLATAVAGGALAAGMVLFQGAWAVTARNYALLLRHWRARGLEPCPAVSLGRSRGIAVPYGVAIACGMLFTFVSRFGSL